MKIKNWKKMAEDRKDWNAVVREAEAHKGL